MSESPRSTYLFTLEYMSRLCYQLLKFGLMLVPNQSASCLWRCWNWTPMKKLYQSITCMFTEFVINFSIHKYFNLYSFLENYSIRSLLDTVINNKRHIYIFREFNFESFYKINLLTQRVELQVSIITNKRCCYNW